MSMPLPSERRSSLSFWGMSSPSPELMVGLDAPLWAAECLLILRNEFSAPQSSMIIALPAGRASIAPLTIEGYLWACRSLLSGEFPSHSEEWVPLRSPAHDGACRSLLSGGVPSHSEEWVLHSPELVVGLTLRSEFSALELLIGSWVPLIPRNEFSALQSSPSVD